MIVYKFWTKDKRKVIYTWRNTWEGWFLFGIIPLYVRLVKSEKF